MQEFFSDNGIYYRSNNIDPERQSLLFIHGITGSSSAWAEFENRFKDAYNVVTIDLRGHGLSKKFVDYKAYKINSISEDICMITQDLGLKEIVLIGHSFGTLVSLKSLFLLNKVRSVIFLSPVFNVKQTRLAIFSLPITSFLANIVSILPFAPGKGGHVNYSKYKNTGDWNLRVFAADIANTSFRIFLFYMKHLYHYDDMKALLNNIRVPALVVHGTKDSVMPISRSRLSADQITNCKFVPIPGGNHVMVRDKPDIISDEIERFIKAPAS